MPLHCAPERHSPVWGMPVGWGSTVSLVLGPRLPNMGNGSDSSRRGEPRRSAEAITPRSITGVAQLIPAAAEGDAAALGELLAALLPIAERYTRPFLASRRDGYDAHQDLLQEWTVRVLRALPNCRATADEQLVDWALAIARRTIAQFYRAEWSHMSGREDIAECSVDVCGQATPEDETDPESCAFSIRWHPFSLNSVTPEGLSVSFVLPRDQRSRPPEATGGCSGCSIDMRCRRYGAPA